MKKQNALLKNASDKYVGQTFGRLTVVKPAGSTDTGAALVTCKCSCGNETIARLSHLKDGSVKSCGCLKKEMYKNQIIDLTSQRFGKLIVIEQTPERNSKGEVLWRCKCDCGEYTLASGQDLKDNHKQSCGKCLVSRGELKIRSLLQENNITFEEQKTFDSCRFPDTNYLARFDFYLPKYNLLIEYDGEQHFKSRSSGWNTQEVVDKTQWRDSIKNRWCEENNIPLKRVPYYDLDKITIEYLLKDVDSNL